MNFQTDGLNSDLEDLFVKGTDVPVDADKYLNELNVLCKDSKHKK